MNNLNILYKVNKEIIGNSLEIISSYDSQSFIEIDKSEKKFVSLEELASFSKELLSELKVSSAYILSVEEFNKSISSSVKGKEDFTTIFSRFGTKIDNDASKGSKGIFDKIFS